ncbi:MAG: YqiA/YcfP family alpha/beta fold hydrolase [Vibrio sp.]
MTKFMQRTQEPKANYILILINQILCERDPLGLTQTKDNIKDEYMDIAKHIAILLDIKSKQEITDSEIKAIMDCWFCETAPHKIDVFMQVVRDLQSQFKDHLPFSDQKKIQIFYLNGWGSCFDDTSAKIQCLNQIGNVSGNTIDYTKPESEIIAEIAPILKLIGTEVIIGTSMGGYLASKLSEHCNIPFIAINPAIEPRKTLQKYLGHGKTYQGDDYYLDQATLDSYSTFSTEAEGLILLDEGDELIDAHHTKSALENTYFIQMFKGGNHRFDHMQESLALIKLYVHPFQL